MKNIVILCIACFVINVYFTACKPGRVITKAIAPKDTTMVIKPTSVNDSLVKVKEAINIIKKQIIDFKTFNSKVKLDIQTADENRDLNGNIKIIKDSVIWISISHPLAGEVFRAFITKDSVTLLDKTKSQKVVYYRSIDYLQELTNIPFDYKTIQDLLIGNPIFFNENNVTVKNFEKYTLVNTADMGFKNLITLLAPSNLLEHCKLDDIDITKNRTADFTFDGYENADGFTFATQREIIVTEKNKLEVKMRYKNYEFNKELSLNFNVPKSYKKK
jgi:Domain of unknown function (DUF4292)